MLCVHVCPHVYVMYVCFDELLSEWLESTNELSQQCSAFHSNPGIPIILHLDEIWVLFVVNVVRNMPEIAPPSPVLYKI